MVNCTCSKPFRSASVVSRLAEVSAWEAGIRAVADEVGEWSLVLGEIGGDMDDIESESREERETWDELLGPVNCPDGPEVGT